MGERERSYPAHDPGREERMRLAEEWVDEAWPLPVPPDCEKKAYLLCRSATRMGFNVGYKARDEEIGALVKALDDAHATAREDAEYESVKTEQRRRELSSSGKEDGSGE